MHREYHPTAEPHKRRPIRWWALAPWLIAAYLATGLYSVGPDEVAVVRRCGRVLAEWRGPGLHFGFPYGIDRVDRLKLLERKREGVGTTLTERVTGRKSQPQQSECLTGDRNLILVSAIVQYRVADPNAFLFQAADVPALIRDVAGAALATAISSMKVDDILTVDRITIQNRVKQSAQAALSRYGAGVAVESVSLEEVRPPEEVADAFRDVTAAREDAQRTKNEAEAYAKRVLPEARGQAERMRMEAEADAGSATRKAQGQADRFTEVLAELASGRELTIKRLILETMEEVLPRLNKIVVGSGAGDGLDLGIFEEER